MKARPESAFEAQDFEPLAVHPGCGAMPPAGDGSAHGRQGLLLLDAPSLAALVVLILVFVFAFAGPMLSA